MSKELVLIVSDLFIPLRTPEIDIQFRSILVPNKIQHVLCLGNVGNQETFDWLHSLSSDFHVIRGDYDINKNLPEKLSIQIGNFKIGMIHGHQIIPMGDLEILSNVQRELDCDILASGYTHQLSVNIKENKLYLNPGSISGALSPLNEDCIPSFILMVLQGEDATIYSYVLSDKTKKFEVGQMEYFRGSNELKIIKAIGEEGEKEEKEEKEEKDKENNEKENEKQDDDNKINEEKNDLEKKEEENKDKNNEEENNTQQELINDNNPSSLTQKEENKEAENKDEKMDE
jgi:vacuolar protein sorting-associated protein 29